jgi:hypothetical protein
MRGAGLSPKISDLNDRVVNHPASRSFFDRWAMPRKRKPEEAPGHRADRG